MGKARLATRAVGGLRLEWFLCSCVLALSMAPAIGAERGSTQNGPTLHEAARLGESRFRAPALLQAVRAGKSTIVGVDVLGHVVVWDRRSGRSLVRLSANIGTVTALSLVESADSVFIASDTGLWQVRIPSGSPCRRLAEPVLAMQARSGHVVALTPRRLVHWKGSGAPEELGRPPGTVLAIGFLRKKPAVILKTGDVWIHNRSGWECARRLPNATSYALLQGVAACADGTDVRLVELSTGTEHAVDVGARVRGLRTTGDGLILLLENGLGERSAAFLRLTDPPSVSRVPLPHLCLPGLNSFDLRAQGSRTEAVFAVGAVVVLGEDDHLPPSGGHQDSIRYVRFVSASRLLSADAHELILWDWPRRSIIARRKLQRCPGLPLVAYAPLHKLVAYVHGTREVRLERVEGDGIRWCLSFRVPTGNLVSAITWLRGQRPRLVVAFHQNDGSGARLMLTEINPRTLPPSGPVIAKAQWAGPPVVRMVSAAPLSFLTLDAGARAHLWRYENGRLLSSEVPVQAAAAADVVSAGSWYVLASDCSESFGARALSCERLTASGSPDGPGPVTVIYRSGGPADGYRARLLAARASPTGALVIAAAAGPVLLVDREEPPSSAEWSSGESVLTAGALSKDGKAAAVGLSSGNIVILQEH